MISLKTIAAVVFSFYLFSPTSFSKEPAFILYSDGTWEKAGSSALPAPNTATLRIQAGITMKSGDTKPVSNTKVILTKIGIPQIFKSRGITKGTFGGLQGATYTSQWGTLSTYEKLSRNAGMESAINMASKTGREDLSKIAEAFLTEKVAEDTTDFNGQAVFAALPIRRVYANVLTELGGGGSSSAWSVPIDLKPGDNKLILSNDNLDKDYD